MRMSNKTDVSRTRERQRASSPVPLPFAIGVDPRGRIIAGLVKNS